jgi:CheY-like chemotaxis protein
VRLLVIDDDPSQLQAFRELLPTAAPEVTLTTGTCLEDALGPIESAGFDAAVIDLRLPPRQGEAEADAHGIAVVDRIRNEMPGTPVIVLTGYGSMELVQRTYGRYMRDGTPFGGKTFKLFEIITKEKLRDCFDRLIELCQDWRELRDIELEFGARSDALSHDEKRILKTATRLSGSVRADVWVLKGGLSGAGTFRVLAFDESGRTRNFAFAKIGSLQSVGQERLAFENHVAGSLRAGAFATFLREVHPAGTRLAGLFYRLAESNESGKVRSLFDEVVLSPDAATLIVKALADICRPWTENVPITRMRVGDLRRELIDDDKFAAIDPELFASTREIEQRKVNVKRGPQHRDLHGENVLVQRNSAPMLIDFGLVGEAPTGLDAVILELSLICHAGGRALVKEWPSSDSAERWIEVERYVDSAPEWAKSFIRSCREWGLSVAGGSNAYAACGYAFAIRQLRFSDVDRTVILAVAKSCMRHLSNN